MASSVFYGGNSFSQGIDLTADTYLNWGATVGTSGYGLRDNAGTIEFKNTGGSWAGVASSASGGGWQRVGTVVSLVTGTDTLASNLRPTDATYTSGDGTHGWLSTFIHTTANGDQSQGLFLQDNSGPVVTIDPWTNGTLEVNLGDFGAGGAFVFKYGSTVDLYAFSGANIFAGDPATGEIHAISSGVSRLVNVNGLWAVTGGSATDQYQGIYTNPTFGKGGVAQKGVLLTFAGDAVIEGSGDATNEYSGIFSSLNMKIGTGYTQTAGPTGNLWGADSGVHGPIALQPGLLGGITQVVNNYYNGSPSLAASNAMSAVTYPGVGAGIDATHAAGTTFPMNVGLYVGGKSGTVGAPNGIGFTTGIQVGGSGSNWQVPASFIGTGLNISQYATAGININAATSVTAPSIIFDTFLQSAEMASAPAAPAANGVRIYAVDNGGKTELLAIFASGAAQRIAIQP